MQLTILKGMQGSGKTKFIETIVGANKIADTGYDCIYEKDGNIFIESNQDVKVKTINKKKNEKKRKYRQNKYSNRQEIRYK